MIKWQNTKIKIEKYSTDKIIYQQAFTLCLALDYTENKKVCLCLHRIYKVVKITRQ